MQNPDNFRADGLTYVRGRTLWDKRGIVECHPYAFDADCRIQWQAKMTGAEWGALKQQRGN